MIGPEEREGRMTDDAVETTTLREKAFVFVAGVEGSGTTALLKLLSCPDACIALGGNYWSPDMAGYSCRDARDRLHELTMTLWSSPERPGEDERRKLIRAINAVPVPGSISHVAYKRSYPFRDGEHYPVLSDIAEIGRDSAVIVMRRNLERNARSMLRRKFTPSLSEAEARARESWRVLRSQLDGIELPVLEVRYETMVSDREAQIERIERFLGFPGGALLAHAALITGPTGGAPPGG